MREGVAREGQANRLAVVPVIEPGTRLMKKEVIFIT